MLAAFQKFGAGALAAGVQVRHLDGNKQNNADSNIAIGDHSANYMDIAPEERRRRAQAAGRGAARKLRRFTDDEVREIRRLHGIGYSYRKLGRMFSVVKSTIRVIVLYKHYAHVV